MKELFRIFQAPDGSFVLFAGNTNEIVAARTDYHDLTACIQALTRPTDEPRMLSNDGVPPTGGFPRVVAGNDVSEAAEPTKRKGLFR